MVRLRLLLPAFMVGLVVLSRGVTAEAISLYELENLPAGVDPADKKFLEDKKAAREKVMTERKDAYDKYKKFVDDLQAQRQKVMELGSAAVTIDEQTIPVPEPANMEAALGLKQPVRDPYEVSPDDFQIYVHDRWSINLSDFHADAPQYISADSTYGNAKTWFGFTYTVTNPTFKKRRIAPMFTAVTDKGVFNQAVGGLIAEREMADAHMRPLPTSNSPLDKELLKQGVAPLEPGSFLALYALDLKIVVNGLANAHRYEEKMRRALVLTYERKGGDEFHVYREVLKHKDTRWEYLWMWDQSIAIPVPADAKEPQIKVQTLKTPAGADKLAWAFPFVVTNSTRASQELAINSVAFACPVEVDVGGTKVPVEARVVDDGRSTIYKAQMLKALTKESPQDRYQFNKAPDLEGSKTLVQRRKVTIEAGKNLDEVWAVFDEADVDWDNVKMQVEAFLTDKLDKKAVAKQTWEQLMKAVAPDKPELLQKDPGFLYDPRRRLTDEELKQVQDQVAKGLAGAIDKAKGKKTMVAYFDCTSGLSTGSYRVTSCYRQHGVVDEAWLKAWEDLDKPAAAGAETK
ncbi:MAG: hypothetical protein NTW87_22075 [Planctomycetota bacterium]|nr:hypothetical protein [Planctomycetota bacterium]